MTKTRECEMCKDWTDEFIFENEPECYACNGTKVLDASECFCHAYYHYECACDADWSGDDYE